MSSSEQVTNQRQLTENTYAQEDNNCAEFPQIKQAGVKEVFIEMKPIKSKIMYAKKPCKSNLSLGLY